ncbi:olfactory receptor 52H1-like [Polypterus senegalus]|uniref:olfactory receptor 52H1-like n=1 Tax=Polypterus senegalus TaxID=55291 RepID=UPI00196264AE|nr:olfactory receptor 52H1-like [Polypterus senegalus]
MPTTSTNLSVSHFNYSIAIFHTHLHGPMYVMLCNLIMCDLFGSTAVMPRLMADFFVDVKVISFAACIIQAFFIHMYYLAGQLVLAAMALDRYVAICNPLRYNTIMTPRMVVKLCSIAWAGAFIMVVILLSTTINLKKCKSLVVHAYCFNGALFVLACGDYTANNIYGLFITYFPSTLSISAIVFTYTKILIACFFKAQANAKSKALQTCASHLTVYVIFETTLLFSIMALRFPNINPTLTKIFGTVMITVPPCLNPLIYGINTKEIRNTVLKHLKKKITSS